MKTIVGLMSILFLAVSLSSVSGDLIYVAGTGHEGISSAVNNLRSLGHSVDNGSEALSDYSGYDQVWDMRFSDSFTVVERNVLASFLQSGGGVYISGENENYQSRNNSVNSYLVQVGAGTVGFVGNTGAYPTQEFTAAGQILNTPNSVDGLTILYGRTVSAPSSGFLVTEDENNPGSGTTVAWDFGDISSSPDSRMVVGFDVESFQLGGIPWTENVVTYLGATSVPEPSSVLVLGLSGLLVMTRRRARTVKE